MPSDVSGGLGNFWWSQNMGSVHYISLDTETDLGHGLVGPDEAGKFHDGPFGSYANQQVDFLQKDLASVNRTETPWVIVGLHRPWYVQGGGNLGGQVAFEPLFQQYGVDMYMTGHAHFFQRNKPIFNNTIDPNGLNNPSAPWPSTYPSPLPLALPPLSPATREGRC